MSGFFAIYHRTGNPVSKDILLKLQNSMLFRGPDKCKIWFINNIGLGHCLLKTTPESEYETLPYYDSNTNLVITADARIDNREDLNNRLGLNSDARIMLPDSQYILRAYEKWGYECVNYLIGDFAFVIWDKGKQELFCSRDHLGVRPVYYHLTDELFIVASTATVIFEVPNVSKNINEGRIVDFLIPELEGIDKTSTFYKEINRLPSAHCMVIKKDHMNLRQYWSPDPDKPQELKSENEYIEAYKELLTASVRARIRSNTQTVTMLSGGIDSSSIAGVAQQIYQGEESKSQIVYSAISDNFNNCEESQFIKDVIAHTKAKSFTITPNKVSNYEEKLQSTIDKLHEPFDAMTMIILIYILADINNHRVVLDGVEGDMVHSLPVDYPFVYLRKGRLFKAVNEIRGIWINTFHQQYPFNKLIKDSIASAFVSNYLIHWRRRYLSPAYERYIFNDSYINREFAMKNNVMDRLKKLHSYNSCKWKHDLGDKHVNTIMHPYLTNALERYDRVAALCNIEARHPLLDKRLIDFVTSIPDEYKARNGWSKYLLRKTSQQFLPEQVSWRQGHFHLGWSFTQSWLARHQQKYKSIIQDSMPQLENYVDSQSVHTLLHQDISGNGKDEQLFWRIYNLATWLNKNTNYHKKQMIT